jgi:hypothetical protein
MIVQDLDPRVSHRPAGLEAHEKDLMKDLSQQPITPERMDELLRFLPQLENPGEELDPTWNLSCLQEDGSLLLPYNPNYPQMVEEFFRQASLEWWQDYEYKPEIAGKMVASDEAIASASLAEIKTMLTYCVRGERFCDGHWGVMVRKGRIGAILRRLKELRSRWGTGG